VEDAYRELSPLLLGIACRRFGLPAEDAQDLVQDIFCGLLAARRPIHTVRGWLIGAVAIGCRSYWRHHTRRTFETLDVLAGRAVPGPALADDVIAALVLVEVQEQLAARDAAVLGWHYVEGETAPEIATRLGITPAYATLLIHRCLTRARRAYRQLSRPAPPGRTRRTRQRSALERLQAPTRVTRPTPASSRPD
jgi:DNA-directed RNA polymerase specialized sigma24 family protein